jgi:hypothetical protein
MTITAHAALLVATVTAAATGCSGPAATCGPDTAPIVGLIVTAATAPTPTALSYGGLVASANNDCPDPAAPAGVVSLTIGGKLDGGTDPVSLCVPRPDQLASGALALGADTGAIHIVDLRATAAGCTYAFDRTIAPTGSATAAGVCGAGSDPRGFALTFNGAVTLKRTCGATIDSVRATIAGTVAVAGPPA